MDSAAIRLMQYEEARDQISVMLKQESTIYRCQDYMEHERPSVNSMCSHIVEECASVVTDHSCPVQQSLHHKDCSPPQGSSMNKVQSETSIRDVLDVDSRGGDPLQQQQHDQTFTFWRQQMFDWACMVVDSFGMQREVVAVSFNLLDRYIVTELQRYDSPPITRDDYQLFSMTCLYIAIKILEPYPRKLSVQTLVDMSKNYYSKAVIEQTELDMLDALQWHLHPPTAVRFGRLFTKIFSSSSTNNVPSRMKVTMEALTEIAVSDSFFVACKPSVIGLACVMHAARLEGIQEYKIQNLLHKVQDLVPTRDCPEFRTVYLQLEKLYCNDC